MAWFKLFKTPIDLPNDSEGCFDWKLLQANVKATSVMTLICNLSIITAANFERNRHAGSMRMMEMLATIGDRLLAFQPHCMPADKQGNQLRNNGSEGPCKVLLMGDDLLDLGALNTEVDGQTLSAASSRLGTRPFLHHWERSWILQGKIEFEDCRVVTYLTLTQIVSDIATHYQKDLAVVGSQGGRIPHCIVLVWTGTELKVKITKHASMGSMRPNHHSAVYDDHYSASDNARWQSAQIAAHQLGELVHYFMGIIILFTGCADIWDLDTPGKNSQIYRIMGGRESYNLYAGEIRKIVQDHGVICFPCMTSDGFPGKMSSRHRQSEGKCWKLHFDAHPALAVEISNFLANAVMDAATFSTVDSLTLRPREGRVPLVRIKSFLDIDWMRLWRISESNPRGLDGADIAKETEMQRVVHECALVKKGCHVPHSVYR